jgi:hypothetical protein
VLDYHCAGWGGVLYMPGCFRANEKDEDEGDDWREPPGYLGEAVRRAKLIRRRADRSEPPEAEAAT